MAGSGHERLDGSGYPYHKEADQLSLGSRIMAVADIYTAITEDRPYRKGLPAEVAFSQLDEMVANGKIETAVVKTLKQHQDEIETLRRQAQQQEGHELAGFWQLAAEATTYD